MAANASLEIYQRLSTAIPVVFTPSLCIIAAALTPTGFLQTYNLFKKAFTSDKAAALCKEAVQVASRASAAPGIESSPPQDVPRRAGNVWSYVHPDSPPFKERKPLGTDDDGDSTCDALGIDITGNALYDGVRTEATEIEKKPDLPTGEVTVVRKYGVADKKGQRDHIARSHTVSTHFGQSSVDAYLTLLTSVLSWKMDNLTSRPAASSSLVGLEANEMPDKCLEDAPNVLVVKEEVVGLISYTEELSKNVVRTGVPPPLPKFTRVAMWRGEDVRLNQLGAGDMEELLVGINWCEPK